MRGFEAAVDHVLSHEGGYVDHPADPGGATNMGITHATLARYRGKPVSKADVGALTRHEAAAIYHALYWRPVSGDHLPPPLALMVFDCAVNQGRARAARWLQRSVGASPDGIIGPKTLAAAQASDLRQVIVRFSAYRLFHYTGLSIWPVFRKGWTRRLLDTLWVSARAR